jgi:hypothetical protein
VKGDGGVRVQLEYRVIQVEYTGAPKALKKKALRA